MDVSIDFTDLRAKLDALADHQVPYAAMKSLNTLAATFQDVQREHDLSVFAHNRPDWLSRNIKQTHFATKTEQFATVGIHAPGDESRSDILTKFEDGGTKTSIGKGLITIPVQPKLTSSGVIPPSMRPGGHGGLNLHQGPRGNRGSQRTFIVTLANGDKAIFQRLGTKSRDKRRLGRRLLGLDPSVVLLYILKPSVPIPKELDFYVNAHQVTSQRWSSIFEAAWADALATAR